MARWRSEEPRPCAQAFPRNPKRQIEFPRTIRSFGLCFAFAVHVAGGTGEERIRVKAR
ncbi:MAG TPA: hypothetical protein VFP39_15565 [Gemmatimonadales bacterium]|nr:hypothetical protein [Gemmatimonadales bacterium]